MCTFLLDLVGCLVCAKYGFICNIPYHFLQIVSILYFNRLGKGFNAYGIFINVGTFLGIFSFPFLLFAKSNRGDFFHQNKLTKVMNF